MYNTIMAVFTILTTFVDANFTITLSPPTSPNAFLCCFRTIFLTVSDLSVSRVLGLFACVVSHL